LRHRRVRNIVKQEFGCLDGDKKDQSAPSVQLVEYDSEGENKIITALLFEESDGGLSWDVLLDRVRSWSDSKKRMVLSAHLKNRTERWQKVGRAFENAFVRFEIVMNAGAYRDLHRHRMHTQERQLFTTHLGYEVPEEIEQFGLGDVLRRLMEEAHKLFVDIEEHDPQVAQDVVTMFHFVRFYQYQNLRQFFWESELRTISQGRSDYRWIEQEKFRLLCVVYPLITEYVLIDMNDYDLTRRGQEKRSEDKEKRIRDRLS